MHIQEGTNTTLTTCTKMTEEVDRRHGVNGNSSGKAVNEDVPVHNSAHPATGGRLKFFKDGKFILELVRGCAAEGERSGWVSVPRRTFWPPAATATPPAPPALSLSDDTSSLHSSPWQRDHCWKQQAPRRHTARHLALYYCRPKTLTNAIIALASRSKRRRPLDTAHNELPQTPPTTHDVAPDRRRNGDVDPDRDAVDGTSPADDDRWTDLDREKYYHMKLKKPYQYHKLRAYRRTATATRRGKLTPVVEKLRERIAALPVPVNAKLASCRQEHAMVSPRKRILRELERVSLEDAAGKRRARPAPPLSTASYPPPASPGPSHAPPAPRPAPPPAPPAPVSKNVSSYSIHSLLSMGEESPSRRSPHSLLKTESPSSVQSGSPSPSPEAGRVRRAGGALESPPPDMGRYRPYATASGYGRGWAAPWREGYVYPYAYVPPLYRAPAPLWMQYAVAPGPWPPPLGHPLLTDIIPKDEPSSDLPLNLSKH